MKLIYVFIFGVIYQVFDVDSHLSGVRKTPFKISDLKRFAEKYIDDYVAEDFPFTIQQVEVLKSLYEVLKERTLILENGQMTQCLMDMEDMRNGARSQDQHILKMIDATGKPGSGLLSGKLQFWGDFDQCSASYVPRTNVSKDGFSGQYCLLDMWKFGNLTLPVRWGLCIPDSCDGSALKAEIFHILNDTEEFSLYFEEDILTSIDQAIVTCPPKETELSSTTWVLIFVVVFWLILCILAASITLIQSRAEKNLSNRSIIRDGQQRENAVESFEILESQNEKKSSALKTILVEGKKILLCFCPIRNTMEFVKVRSSEDQVKCLDGIRFIGSLWVILSHTLGYLMPVLGNTIETASLVDKFAFQVIINGFYSVDIFFLLSGFLLVWGVLKRQGKAGFFVTILHRLIRLYPIYAAVVLFQTLVFHHLGSGPVWPVDGRQCKEYWWTNLLFLNNILLSEHQCMMWSWYMASDFQYFVFSLLFWCLFKKWPRFVLAIAGFFGTASVVFSFVVTYMFDMFTGPANNIDLFLKNPALMDSKFSTYFLGLYIHPLGRYHVHVVGIFLAYILFKQREATTDKQSKTLYYVGAISATTFSFLCIYGLNAFGHILRTTLLASIYNSLHHLVFSLCLAWFVYQCSTGKLGFFNRILSARILVPLSRLSYSAYLLHPIVMEAYFLSLRTPFQYSHLSLVILNFGFITVTYLIALVVAILIGAPFANLESYLKERCYFSTVFMAL